MHTVSLIVHEYSTQDCQVKVKLREAEGDIN